MKSFITGMTIPSIHSLICSSMHESSHIYIPFSSFHAQADKAYKFTTCQWNIWPNMPQFLELHAYNWEVMGLISIEV